MGIGDHSPGFYEFFRDPCVKCLDKFSCGFNHLASRGECSEFRTTTMKIPGGKLEKADGEVIF